MARTNVIISALLAATFISSCSLAPDFKKPEITVGESYKEDADALQGKWQEASASAGTVDQTQWWLVFNDTDLNALQDQAASANNTLKSAAARLEQARGLSQQARSSYFPSLDLGTNAFRGNSASRSLGGASKPTSSFAVQGTVSYEADLFGRVRSTANAAEYNEKANEALYRQALLMVHGDVAENYYRLLALDTERDLLRQSIQLREDAVKLLDNQFKEGEASEQDNLRAQAELASTKAELSSVDQSRALTEHALALLVGKTPSELTLKEKKLPNSLPVIPAGLPSTLLERRPDVASAENQLRAANERIGAARAAFFPQLMLTASGGVAGPDLGDLFKWSSRSWALGPLLGTTLSMPLFDGGQRKGLLRQAKGAYQENVADYRQQVLIAFKDVEDNLSNLRLQKEQADQLFTASTASDKAYRISNVRYKEGEALYLEVLDTQRDMLTAQRAYTQVQGARFVTTIAMIRALGGGWTNVPSQQPIPEKAVAPAIETDTSELPAATAAETKADIPAPLNTTPVPITTEEKSVATPVAEIAPQKQTMPEAPALLSSSKKDEMNP